VYWLLGSSVREEAPGLHRPPLFRGQVVLSYRFRRGIVLVYQRKHRGRDSKPSGKACTSSRKGLSQTSSGMTGELYGPGPPAGLSHICPCSGCPMVVMVQPAHDRKSDHLVPCMMRGYGWSAWSRNLLLDPLMRSCLIEVLHIGIEHPL